MQEAGSGTPTCPIQLTDPYRNPYIKGPKRQFFLDFFMIFWAAREAALAADLITAWKTSGEAALAADLITAARTARVSGRKHGDCKA